MSAPQQQIQLPKEIKRFAQVLGRDAPTSLLRSRAHSKRIRNLFQSKRGK